MNEVKNNVSGVITPISPKEMFEMFHESVRGQLEKLLTSDATEYLVVYENLELTPLPRAWPSAMAVGPDRTYKTLEEAAGGSARLGDVPSRFLYPTRYCRNPRKSDEQADGRTDQQTETAAEAGSKNEVHCHVDS